MPTSNQILCLIGLIFWMLITAVLAVTIIGMMVVVIAGAFNYADYDWWDIPRDLVERMR